MKDNLSTIDEGCVADGYVFATRTYRYIYVGQRSSEKPQWLKQNPEKWRRKEDVQREAASLAASVETEVNVVAASSRPNSQTSSHDVRKDGGEESDVTFVDTPAGNSSAPHQPTSLRAPMNENVPSSSTQTELPPAAEAATRETNECETDTTPPEETERKQGRVGPQRKKENCQPKSRKPAESAC